MKDLAKLMQGVLRENKKRAKEYQGLKPSAERCEEAILKGMQKFKEQKECTKKER